MEERVCPVNLDKNSYTTSLFEVQSPWNGLMFSVTFGDRKIQSLRTRVFLGSLILYKVDTILWVSAVLIITLRVVLYGFLIIVNTQI